MFEFVLPWPDRRLSPNARLHWAVLSKYKSQYREQCRLITESAGKVEIPEGPMHLLVEFQPPDRRRYDRDNLLSRMKAGLDGMCEALGIDDYRFHTISVRVIAAQKPAQVFVSLLPG